jgi:signal transduction histidine kinase
VLLGVPSTGGARGEALLAVEGVERLLTVRLRVRSPAAVAVAEAAERVRALDSVAVDLCVEELVSQVLCGLCVELEDRGEVASLLDGAADQAHQGRAVFRLRLARGALGAAELLELRPDVAIEGVLAMASVLAPVDEVSLWQPEPGGEAALVAHAGDPPSAKSGTLAEHVLAGIEAGASDSDAMEPHDLLAFPVASGASRPRAVLVARAAPEKHAWSLPVLERATTALGAVLERSSLLEMGSTRETSLSEACERRLLRVALDLHDGPLQNVAGISGDLKLLRHRLAQATAGTSDDRRLLGSVADLEARLDAIDAELRDLSHSLESPAITKRPLAEVLRGEADSFRRRCNIPLALQLCGDVKALTASQRIALVRIVQESLSNIREHSRAREVRVMVSGGRDRLIAEIVDDGCGFDVAATLLDAGRRGRLGLVGVSERARLLGGTCDIRSRPGGPTKVVVELPRWRVGASAGDGAEPGARLVAP